MFFIAAAFYWLNKADQDCGTTFAWVTRAMGPNTGWIAGWAVCMTGILVVGSLADVATYTFFDLIDADGLYDSKAAVTIGAVLLIAAMTTVCVIGTEASARLQMVLMAFQIIPLLLFVVVVLVKVWAGDGPGTSFEPQLAWFNPLNIDAGNINPFSAEAGDLIGAMLLGIFIYWGWESAVNLNEETEGDVTRPGLAGLISTVILLVTYVGVATAVLAWKGIGGAASSTTTRASSPPTRTGALGDDLGKLVLLAVVVSALASTQTTILPAARTSLSMARHEAIPGRLRRGLEALLHPGLLDDRDRRARDRLVRARQADQRELPLRQPHRAGADDRLLLRAHRASPASSTTGARSEER